MLLLASGCSDETPTETSSEALPPPATQYEDTAPLHARAWLKQIDSIAPEHWLASRQAGRDLDPSAPAVAEMRRMLDVAEMRFRDHGRMIANRAVQLETMLKERGLHEPAPDLIETLCKVPGNTRYVESFSSLTQQYYNLRTSGMERPEAIAALRRQNGPGAPDQRPD